MLKTKRAINQPDIKKANLQFVKSESFSLTLSCKSPQRDTTSKVIQLF